MTAWGSVEFWKNLGESPSDPQPAPWDWVGKWIKALESGDYEQGRSKLRRPKEGSYCCLGVLADTVDPTLWDEGNDAWAGQGGIANEGELKRRGIILKTDKQKFFYRLNDTMNYSFSQIAQVIREQAKSGELFE